MFKNVLAALTILIVILVFDHVFFPVPGFKFSKSTEKKVSNEQYNHPKYWVSNCYHGIKGTLQFLHACLSVILSLINYLKGQVNLVCYMIL